MGYAGCYMIPTRHNGSEVKFWALTTMLVITNPHKSNEHVGRGVYVSDMIKDKGNLVKLAGRKEVCHISSG